MSTALVRWSLYGDYECVLFWKIQVFLNLLQLIMFVSGKFYAPYAGTSLGLFVQIFELLICQK